MKIQIQKCHPKAEIPEYQNEKDSGVDLRATEIKRNNEYQVWFHTGLKIAVPDGCVGLIFPRSSITELPLELGNSVGVIDPGYRGEIEVRFNKAIETIESVYEVGERVAQLLVLPNPKLYFEEVEEFSGYVERGEDGFGSTGK